MASPTTKLKPLHPSQHHPKGVSGVTADAAAGNLLSNGVGAVKGAVIENQQRFNRFLRILGPGLITGAADDDPSGIATYSQAGAQFGYGMAWVMWFTLPLQVAVQEACARIGAVTGKGLASVIRERYSKAVLYPVVALVVLANTINIGADIGAMAAAVQLVFPSFSFVIITLLFTIAVLALEIFTSYKTYAKVLKWLALALLAYPVTALLAGQDWGELLKGSLIPHVELSGEFLFLIVAVLGTTISPYLFFWQTSELVEEEIAEHRLAQKGGEPRLSQPFLRKMRLDNFFGMLFSTLAAWFVIITGAAVLHANGITTVNTAADAAKALEPLVQGFPAAGLLSKLIFAVGVVGLGLLAVPVLAGSSAYTFCGAFGWHEGLYNKVKRARTFYGIIAVATVTGLLINFVGIDPIKALVYTAVFNGVAAVPLLFLISRISGNKAVMGEYTGKLASRTLLLIAFLIMTLATVAMFATL
jgi:NRAMP (natural resistance-associated macrophage protein)-like metal ion transporter